VFKHSKLVIYTGAAPTNAEDAATGTALVTISDASGALTPEVLATGTVSITGTAGSVTAITVNSIDILQGTVAYNATAAQTASDLADAINLAQTFPKWTASASGAVVTLTAPRGSGTQPNAHVVAAPLARSRHLRRTSRAASRG
jgi:phage tail sheath gpL-like